MMDSTMGTRGGRSPVRVGTLLTAAVPALAERMLEEAIRREWTDTVGHDAARRSRPKALRQGTLEVSVDNSPWLQELTLRSASIAAALRKRHGSAVTGVRFALGSALGDGDDIPVPAVDGTRAPRRRLNAEEARLVDAAAARVSDPKLATSLKRLLTKDLLARGGRPAPAASEQP
jgi:Dna[CI] antecedent, DciA